MADKKYILFFLFFVGLRLILWAIFGTNLDPNYIIDGIEYKLNGTAFSYIYNTPWHYVSCFERTPIYMIYTFLTQGNLFIQILLCGLAGIMAFKVNEWFGLYFMFYPNYVFQSFNYSKEALLISLTLVLIYFLKDKTVLLFLATIILNLGFISFGSDVIAYNLTKQVPFMQGIWEIWKPTMDVYLYATLGKGWAFIISFPFWLVIPLYFRKATFDISLIISIGITLFFSFGWACGRYREIALPFIIFYLTKNTKK